MGAGKTRARRGKNVDPHEAAAEARVRRMKRLTSGRSYSIPNQEKWARFSTSRITRSMRRAGGFEKTAPAEWSADRATRPVLLVFDAFDTLFTPREPVPKQYCDVASEFGFVLEQDDVKDSFKSAFKKLSAEHPNYGKAAGMHPEDWWKQIIENTLTPLIASDSSDDAVPDELVSALYDRFSSAEGYKLFPDVKPFLSLIGTDSYQPASWPPRRTMLGILSNSDPRVRSILSSFRIPISPALFPPRFAPRSRREFNPRWGPAGFAFASLSYESGWEKPHRMAWDAALRGAQAALNELSDVARTTRTGTTLLDNVRRQFHCMYVGDDLEKDVRPAVECGWDGVLLDRAAGEEVGWREVEGSGRVPVVNNLMGLRELVRKERIEAEGGQAGVWFDEATAMPRTRKEVRRRGGKHIVGHPMETPQRRLERFI